MNRDSSAGMTRRQALRQSGTGLGMLGLVGLLGDAGLLGQALAATAADGGTGPRTSRPGPSTSSTST